MFLIDKDLYFKEHLEYTFKIIRKKIGFFKHIKNQTFNYYSNYTIGLREM